MELIERSVTLPIPRTGDVIAHLRSSLAFHLKASEIPIRFAVTSSDCHHFSCEIGVIDAQDRDLRQVQNIFEYRQRLTEKTGEFNVVLAVPTGIGAEIGGHAGDATAVARVIAQTCNRLVIHPNVVNASDINEMPANSLYVEGSVLSRLMMGTVGLQPTRSNRVLVLVHDHSDRHFVDAAINSVSAARATYGLKCPEIVVLNPAVRMHAEYSACGRAVGRVSDLEHCFDVLTKKRAEYDAVALSSVIQVPIEYHLEYFRRDGEMVNPWGGVEAMLTHAISLLYDIPSAHSPMFESREIENLEPGIVEPRMSAEAVSVSFLQCILKGLHKSPKIVTDNVAMLRSEVFSVENVSCLVIPDGCLGIPTIAALQQGISVIAVRGNRNLMRNDLSRLPWSGGQYIVVDNYLEAAGALEAIKAGVALEAVRRPIPATRTSYVDKNIEASTAIAIKQRSTASGSAV